ncbi:MAG: DUF2974 domain-containing protein [Atopobiaceae bacterium]|nr:DUF2974 domain-containing protein [Atopobiaceae bacterium]
MANIVDYLAWRGDLTFAERPFNDVDNIILSTLSYLDFTDIVPGPGKGAVSLAQASNRVLEETEGNVDLRVRSLARLDPKMLLRLSSSRRFGHILLHDCVDKLDAGRSLQFAALQMDITPELTYVSFRGTDSSLVGWREDFMLSFTITEAQREALTYLECALADARSRGRKVYVGGHSKGGNLAIYAALSCPADLQDVIACIWNNDGPGISHKIIPTSPRELFGERYRRIVPAYDMVGIIFEHSNDPRTVVASSVTGAWQHDPFTWKVLPRGVEEADDLSSESKIMRSALKAWLSNVSLEERAVLVDQFFDALEASGATTLSEVTESVQSMKTVLSAMGGMDDSTKDLLRSLAGNMVAKTMESAANAAFRAAQGVMEELKKLPEADRDAVE